MMKFIVNGRSITVDPELTNVCDAHYEDVCWCAGLDPTRILTVVWSTRTSQGSLTPGQKCVLEEGMVFNVADTSNA